MSGKEVVSEWLRDLPESLTVEHVLDELALRAELRLAMEDADAGRLVSQEEMETLAAIERGQQAAAEGRSTPQSEFERQALQRTTK